MTHVSDSCIPCVADFPSKSHKLQHYHISQQFYICSFSGHTHQCRGHLRLSSYHRLTMSNFLQIILGTLSQYISETCKVQFHCFCILARVYQSHHFIIHQHFHQLLTTHNHGYERLKKLTNRRLTTKLWTPKKSNFHS